MNSQATKRCPKCGEVKPLAEFNRNAQRADGHNPWCKNCTRKDNRRWREANPEAARGACRHYRAEHPEAVRKAERRRYATYREAVFDHYGRVCACCKSTEQLTIDHANGDGKQHRAQIGDGSERLYRWLIANQFPEGFQTLCRPCNRNKSDGDNCRLNHIAAGREMADVSRK